MGSNYEKQVYLAREIFLKYDQEALIEKLSLQHDENYLYLELLNCRYRIDRKTGAVEKRTETADAENAEMQGEECMDYQVVMTLYDMLCYPKETPHLSGEWCTLPSLQVTMSSPSPERLNRAVAAAFSGHVSELKQVCETLHGEYQAVPASADVCYQIPVFPFFPVLFQFWDGDDEFEPKVMILWDRNSLDFMHFETLYYAMNHLLDTMQRMIAEITKDQSVK